MVGAFGLLKAQQQEVNPYDQIPFLNKEMGLVQYYNRADFSYFADQYFSDSAQRIVIAHFGDSHVQPDVYPNILRKGLQKEKGQGGRGMIFPYSIAKTYSQIDYSSSYSGVWASANSIQQPPKLPVGVSGFTAITNDNQASFTITFKESLPSEYTLVKLYCKQSVLSYDVLLSTGDSTYDIKIDSLKVGALPYAAINVKRIGNTLKFQVRQKHSSENFFECYGLSIERPDESGLIYHNLGVGGATFSALLNQVYFMEQFPSLNADLVIMDWGTNDFLYKDTVPADMERIIIATIAKVRSIAPNVTILLTSAQDMNRRGLNVKAGRNFSERVKVVARDQKCLFFDWYWLSGGPHTMYRWVEKKYGQPDNIHLTIAGAKIKGKLLNEALMKALYHYKEGGDSLVVADSVYKQIIVRNDTLTKAHRDSIAKAQVSPTYSNNGAYQWYTVKGGDTLGGIAQRYRTTVKAIMSLNGLRSTTIRIGQRLKIPKRG